MTRAFRSPRLLHIAVFVFLFPIVLRPCDSCGGQTGAALGLMPNVSGHFLGLRARTTQQKTMETSTLNRDQTITTDRFSSIEWVGRHQLNARWQLWAFVPYQQHVKQRSNQTEIIEGLGDASLQGWYTAIQPKLEDRRVKHSLLAGMGLHIPTGKYMKRDERKVLYPAPFQLGTGAFRFSVMMLYSAAIGKGGVFANAMLRTHQENELAYQFGAIRQHLVGSYMRFAFGSYQLIASAGWLAEQNLSNRQFGNSVPSTAGQASFAQLGFELSKNKWSASLQLAPALSYNGSQAPGTRLALGWVWAF